MAENDPLKHIRIDGYTTSQDYTYPKDVLIKFKIKERNRQIHGTQILQQLQQIKQQFRALKEVELPAGIVRDDAIYVEFVSEWGFPLKFDSLDQDSGNPAFQILNIKEESRKVQDKEEFRYQVNLMMTEGGVSKFIKKVNDYLRKNVTRKDKESGIIRDTGVPQNTRLLNNIQNIQLATLRSFWTDGPEIPFPEQNIAVWWEVWFRKTIDDDTRINRVIENLNGIGVTIGASELVFAEHRVRLVRGTAKQLSDSLMLLDNLAELRHPQETADFVIYDKSTYDEQEQWFTDLNQRLEPVLAEKCVLICLLDTGVNNNHPLIAPFLPDSRMYTYKEAWGVYDSHSQGGHGTGVAGLSLFGDMVDALASPHNIRIFHGIESFKILQENDPTDPKLYGSITEYAASTSIADSPNNPRVFCMTVTAKSLAFKGRPSAWSAAIDKIAFGSALDPIAPQLFIISGGNAEINNHSEFPAKNYLDSSVHDPSQAYNVITVGTYTRKDKINDDSGLRHLAEYGAMAPSNSTSTLWDHQWPLKPDIVMEGGNLATDGTSISDHSSLKLLSSDSEYPNYIFLPFGDTSGAAALAAKMGAELKTAYPDFWPETIRGLMIHSAEWTEAMLEGRKLSDLTEGERKGLLRSVGYGVPIMTQAMFSARNSLTLIAEREIQPFRLDGSAAKTNEYHLFQLPWPKDILSDVLYDQDVTLKLTLSYFIEPNPGSRKCRYANNFQYHSHALEFAVMKPNEELKVFKRRISAAANLPDEEKYQSEEEWNIRRVRKRGSIKKDFITMSGADMAKRNVIAIYPVNGWYKTRKKIGKVESKVRYSLIVSLETPNTEIDIYTPVLNQIPVPIPIII